MFDLSLPKLLILAVIALVVFGPNELPKLAARAGSGLRDLRRIADGAKADLRDGLGPEFSDFDLADLNPRQFARKHLLGDLNPDHPDSTSTASSSTAGAAASATAAAGHQKAPYDAEAT